MVNVAVLKNRLQCNLFGHTRSPRVVRPCQREREREESQSKKRQRGKSGLWVRIGWRAEGTVLLRERNGHYRPAGIYNNSIIAVYTYGHETTVLGRTLFMYVYCIIYYNGVCSLQRICRRVRALYMPCIIIIIIIIIYGNIISSTRFVPLVCIGELAENFGRVLDVRCFLRGVGAELMRSW